MVRSVAKKVMWIGRTTVFVVGLAVILALTVGVVSKATAYTGSGGLFHLGHSNAASTISSLVGTVSNGMLQVTNNSTATTATGAGVINKSAVSPALRATNSGGGPALGLNVGSGKAPMTVSSGAAKVTNLDADKLDGNDLSTFLEKDGRLAQSTELLTSTPSGTGTLTPVAEVTITVPGSQKQLVYVDGSVTVFGTNNVCNTSFSCAMAYDLAEKGTSLVSSEGFDHIDSTGYHQLQVDQAFAFVASSGTHTYQLRFYMNNTTSASQHTFSSPVVTATTVPFGGTGVAPASLSSFGASSTAATSVGSTPK
jgi:hypothetical protein